MNETQIEARVKKFAKDMGRAETVKQAVRLKQEFDCFLTLPEVIEWFKKNEGGPTSEDLSKAQTILSNKFAKPEFCQLLSEKSC